MESAIVNANRMRRTDNQFNRGVRQVRNLSNPSSTIKFQKAATQN